MNIVKTASVGGLVVAVAIGAMAQVQAAKRTHVLAASHGTQGTLHRSPAHGRSAVGPSGIDVPGNVADLPQLPPDIRVAALPLSGTSLSARQALDAAEGWSHSTDTYVDSNARAIPVSLDYGLAPGDQNLKGNRTRGVRSGSCSEAGDE